jgi:signal transduction histidine kinase
MSVPAPSPPSTHRGGALLAWPGFALVPFGLNALLLLGAFGRPFPLSYPIAFLALVVLVLALRRGPWTAMLLMLANAAAFAMLAKGHLDAGFAYDVATMQLLAGNVAVGYVAAVRHPRVSIPAALVVLVLEAGASAAFTTSIARGPNPDIVNTTVRYALITVVAWTLGNAIGQRRRTAATRRADAEARLISEERLRIARELHDMVAHSIGVIAIQAGMGRRVIDTQPAEARDALGVIEATSRDTLSALRRMVGTLRGVDTAQPLLAPAPGLADVDALVARTLAAGVKVELEWRGERGPLPPDLDLTAYRIIQEAVTNVVRHSGTQHCRVTVERGDDELLIEVLDEGHGGFTGIGYGIRGMRERVVLLGGQLSAGPQREGGFRVAARIPAPRAAQVPAPRSA